MTEPTRDALQAETLAWLDNDPRDVDWTGAYVERVSAHAAACVREVAALRARPALPADVQAVVERLRGHLVRLDDGDYTDMPDVVQDVSALLAHIQRQDNS